VRAKAANHFVAGEPPLPPVRFAKLGEIAGREESASPLENRALPLKPNTSTADRYEDLPISRYGKIGEYFGHTLPGGSAVAEESTGAGFRTGSFRELAPGHDQRNGGCCG